MKLTTKFLCVGEIDKLSQQAARALRNAQASDSVMKMFWTGCAAAHNERAGRLAQDLGLARVVSRRWEARG